MPSSASRAAAPDQLSSSSDVDELPLRRDPVPASLRMYALAALALRVCPSTAHPGEAPELSWLRRHAESMGIGAGWSLALHKYLRGPASADLPLLYLARELRLHPLELLAVALAEAVEDDPMVGRAVAHIQAPLGGSRPTIGLVSVAYADLMPSGTGAADTLLAGAAVASGLLAVPQEGGPIPERPVSIPTHLCLALHGQDGTLPGTAIGLSAGEEVLLAPSLLAAAQRHAGALGVALRRVLVMRTGSASEGRAAAQGLAAAMQRRALFIASDKIAALGPWLLLRGLLPVFCSDLAPGERKMLPSIPCYQGPVVVLCGPDGMVDAGDALAASWSLPIPSSAERRALWLAALGDPAIALDLAEHYRHGSGRIAHLGRLARHRAALDGRAQPTKADVAAAAWTLEGGGLDALAQPLPDPVGDDAFVMTGTLRAEMRKLVLRCRARDGLVLELGPSATARYHPGVRALFVGPSGTGKTLAAGWLATHLGLPLHRVDLAAVTSKYIGETEKNLAQILARAEQAEVILLFDEADSLFGKRTDVRDANDRFANAQTNYLLQRIETFEGIVILTSNSRSRFDAAFERRLDVIVDFPPPGPEERRALWLAHLGVRHRLAQREINQLAARVDLCGGHIRNAVLTAAVVARDEGVTIDYTHVVNGVASEYRKLGRQVPGDLQMPGR